MSGSSALAAAKRRRSKNEAIVKPNKDDFKYTQNQPTKPSLTVSESIMYLNNRLSNLEKMFQFNSFPQNKELTSDLENKLKTIENNLNELKLLIDNKDSTNVENAEDMLSVSMFNNVIQEVATDMGELNEKVIKQNEYLSEVQNMNITLNNTVSKLLLEKYNVEQEQNINLTDEQCNIKLSINDISDTLNLFNNKSQNNDLENVEDGESLENVEEGESLENVEDGESLENVEGGESLENVEGGDI